MKITLQGNFTEEELIEFAKLLRKMEQTRPSDLFFMLIQAKDMTYEQAKEITKKVYDASKTEIIVTEED